MDNNEFNEFNGPPRIFPAATTTPTPKVMMAASLSPLAVLAALAVVTLTTWAAVLA
jgi:hypothetical protein